MVFHQKSVVKAFIRAIVLDQQWDPFHQGVARQRLRPSVHGGRANHAGPPAHTGHQTKRVARLLQLEYVAELYFQSVGRQSNRRIHEPVELPTSESLGAEIRCHHLLSHGSRQLLFHQV